MSRKVGRAHLVEIAILNSEEFISLIDDLSSSSLIGIVNTELFVDEEEETTNLGDCIHRILEAIISLEESNGLVLLRRLVVLNE